MSGYWKSLEAKNWVPSGTVTIGLDGLPPQYRVRRLLLAFFFAYTKATNDAVAGSLIPQLISNLRIQNYFNLGGLESYMFRWAITSRLSEQIADITSAQGTGGNIFFNLEIPFRDSRQPGSDDGSLPTEMLVGRPIEVTFDSATKLGGAGPITITSGTVRGQVEMIHETNIPQLNVVGYQDQASQTIVLPAGIYKDLFLFKPGGAYITTTDVATLDVIADGKAIMQNMRLDQLVSAWNSESCIDQQGELPSGLTQQASGVPFLPLIWQDKTHSNLSKQLASEKDIRLQITAGSLTTGRLVYSRVNFKEPAHISQAARLIGVPPGATHYEPATASKSPVPTAQGAAGFLSRKARLLMSALAGKARTQPTPSPHK